jgi:hypothetical protein
MNHLLYNISIVMLLIGILMLTYYLTKAYNNQSNINNTDINDDTENTPSLDEIYNMRPSKTFKVMFNEPSIWQGYETIDNKNKPLGAKNQS